MTRHRRAAAAASLASLALLAACASGSAVSGGAAAPGPAASDSPLVGSSPPVAGSGPTRTVTVVGSRITPAPSQVDLAVGETLSVTVTSDRATELHAHGFDIEERLTAGTPTTVSLTGAAPGVYEVETHDPSLLLFTVAVR